MTESATQEQPAPESEETDPRIAGRFPPMSNRKTVKEEFTVLGAPVLKKNDRWDTAERFLMRASFDGLINHSSDWLEWRHGAHRKLEHGTMTRAIRSFLALAVCRTAPKSKDEKPELREYLPVNNDVREVLNCARDISHRRSDLLSPPCWTNGADGPPADEIISFPNYLLHLPTGGVMEPTPDFFTYNAIEFDYDPDAPNPKLWLATLDQYWPRKPDGSPADEVLLLQEIIGYLLLPDTSMQKMFFFLGVTRGGKGLIARIIRLLVGARNTASPSLSSLGGEFGLMPLIAKQLAIISEMVLTSGKDNTGLIVARLLGVSGEDAQSINRKNQGHWEGRLPTRFLCLGNEIPTFADAGGALGNRMIILRFSTSFLGREDKTLEPKLQAELPGILNWAIKGWRRLKQRGHFVETESGLEAKATFIDTAAPAAAFIEDSHYEVVGPDTRPTVTEDQLYAAYKNWCADCGVRPLSKNQFGNAVEAGYAGRVRRVRPREVDMDSDGGVRRPRMWTGIRDAHPM